jgi:hypothetical protein
MGVDEKGCALQRHRYYRPYGIDYNRLEIIDMLGGCTQNRQPLPILPTRFFFCVWPELVQLYLELEGSKPRDEFLMMHYHKML